MRQKSASYSPEISNLFKCIILGMMHQLFLIIYLPIIKKDIIMLVHSNKPQVIKLKEIQDKEREKFSSGFNLALSEVLSTSANRSIKSSLLLANLLKAIPDIYYTFTTLYLTRRRLGEEYTYIAMYKQKHYMEEGVLLNKKVRTLLILLEIISRNVIKPLLCKFIDANSNGIEGTKKESSLRKFKVLAEILHFFQRGKEQINRYCGSATQIMNSMEWLILMIYMLDWNKHFTFIETLLGIRYVYTYKNDQIKETSYAIEGYLLLITFIVKTGKNLLSIYKSQSQQFKKHQLKLQEKNSLASESKGLKSKHKEKNLCRICYDQIKSRSSTKCGHIFCWSCIIQTLEISQQCPVCRTSCLPREVVQLKNI